MLDITWYGQACFRLRERDFVILTDPYDKSAGLSLPRLKADVITLSRPVADVRSLAGYHAATRVLDSPGEYEIGNVFITGIASWDKQKNNGGQHIRHTLFVFDVDGVTVCHMGSLGHVPTQRELEELGSVDILLIPVGGGATLDAVQAAEVISAVEPATVVPMLYSVPGLQMRLDPVERFLRQVGVTEAIPQDSVRVAKAPGAEDGQIQVVLLNCKQ